MLNLFRFRFLFLLASFCVIYFTSPHILSTTTFAIESNCVITNIGNTKVTPVLPPHCQNGATTEFGKAAAAAVNAFKTCAKGKTFPGHDACLRQSLQSAGFADKNISAFLAKRYFSQRYGCVECASFVQTVMSLHSGTGDVQSGNGGDYAWLPQFNAGSTIFKRLTPGTPVQNGDIGSSKAGGFGHILIVKEAKGNIKFTAYESNFTKCTATDTLEHSTTGYYFFRSTDKLALVQPNYLFNL